MAPHRIPARRAGIFWNGDPKRRRRAGGTEVLVVDLGQTYDDPGKLSCSAGAMAQGWMASNHPTDNPAGLFASVWLRRDASPDAIRAALEQFAALDECEWAREMLAAFDYIDGLE